MDTITATIKGVEYKVAVEGKVGKCFSVLLAKHADKVEMYTTTMEGGRGHGLRLRNGVEIYNRQLKAALKEMLQASKLAPAEKPLAIAPKPKKQKRQKQQQEQAPAETVEQPASAFLVGSNYTTVNGTEVVCEGVEPNGDCFFKVLAGGHGVEGFGGMTEGDYFKTTQGGENLDSITFPEISGLDQLNIKI